MAHNECHSNEEYLEELITRVLDKHEVALKEEVEQVSSCVLPLVVKIMGYIDGTKEEPIVEPIVEPICKNQEEQLFVFEPTEVFDPKELLEPFEQIKEEPVVEEVNDIEEPIVVKNPPFQFTTWLREMWSKVKK